MYESINFSRIHTKILSLHKVPRWVIKLFWDDLIPKNKKVLVNREVIIIIINQYKKKISWAASKIIRPIWAWETDTSDYIVSILDYYYNYYHRSHIPSHYYTKPCNIGLCSYLRNTQSNSVQWHRKEKRRKKRTEVPAPVTIPCSIKLQKYAIPTFIICSILHRQN